MPKVTVKIDPEMPGLDDWQKKLLRGLEMGLGEIIVNGLGHLFSRPGGKGSAIGFSFHVISVDGGLHLYQEQFPDGVARKLHSVLGRHSPSATCIARRGQAEG